MIAINKINDKNIKKMHLIRIKLVFIAIIITFISGVITRAITSNNKVIAIENEVESSEINSNAEHDFYYTSLEEDEVADKAKDIQERLSNWNFVNESEKIAYLTFDDGPSDIITEKILDILNQYDVKATFFVLGSKIESCSDSATILKRMVKDGHAIGNHGYSHEYHLLYPNGIVDTVKFMEDIKKSELTLKNILGNDFKTKVIRFPGGHGSWDTTEIDYLLEAEGYTYVDWNTLNGDAEDGGISSYDMLINLNNTINDLTGNNDIIVTLMHDSTHNSSIVEFLPSALEHLKSLGYSFRTLK